MKCQLAFNAIILGVALFASLALQAKDNDDYSLYFYPFYAHIPIIVQNEGVDDLHNAEGELGLDLEPIVLDENRDMCDFDEICVTCESPEEAQVCDEEGNCCCCQSSGGDEDLSEVLPIGGFAAGGTGSGGVGFSAFGGGFAAGFGGSSGGNGGTDNGSSSGPPSGPPSGGPAAPPIQIPEPSTWLILGTLLAVVATIKTRRRLRND